MKCLSRKFTSRNVGARKATTIIRDMLILSRRATLCTLFIVPGWTARGKEFRARDCTSFRLIDEQIAYNI